MIVINSQLSQNVIFLGGGHNLAVAPSCFFPVLLLQVQLFLEQKD